MIESLAKSSTFATFLTISVILAITPGPSVMHILTRTLGLAVIIAVLSAAFAFVKFAGAAHLLFLGVQTLRAKPAAQNADAPRRQMSRIRLFRDGFVVALLNATFNSLKSLRI